MAERAEEEAARDVHAPPNVIVMADARDCAIRDYANPLMKIYDPGIVRPEVQAAQFELKPVMFQMLQTMGQFSGQVHEDPHLHLRNFLEVCDSFKIPGASSEALRMRLFPFSLRDSANIWLNSAPPGSLTTWNDVAEKFLMKYFPPNRNARLRTEIMRFQQEDDTLCEAWERYKRLLQSCPHHGIPCCIQMETFYNGLNSQSRMVLDASANGALLSKSYNEAFDILERIANNNHQWASERAAPTTKRAAGVAGVHDLDVLTSLTAQIAMMNNSIKNLPSLLNVTAAAPQQSIREEAKLLESTCVYCGEPHQF